MTDLKADPAIADLIDRVVRIGSAYDMEGMAKLYTPDMSILVLDNQGGVQRVPLDAVFAEFRARGESGEPPLSTEHRVLLIEQQGETATALLYRRMSPVKPPVIYELRFRREAGEWRVSGETVTPWPDLAGIGDFLPARTHG